MARFGAQLSSFSIAQLSELLEDDEKLQQIVLDLEEVKEVQQTKQLTQAGNRSLAEQNLELQPGLEGKKNQLTERYRCLQDMFESYQLRKSTLDQSSGHASLDTLLALLQAEGAKIEEETENMADAFLEGAVPLDAFIDEYQSKRKLAHLRRVKIEKLQELLLKSPHILQGPSPSEPPLILSPKPVPVSNAPISTPVPQPRRAPPLPPINTPNSQAQSTPMLAFASSPYPPIPPRVGQTPAGYPSLFMPQYPPPVPQRSAPRMAPQPGFLIQ